MELLSKAVNHPPTDDPFMRAISGAKQTPPSPEDRVRRSYHHFVIFAFLIGSLIVAHDAGINPKLLPWISWAGVVVGYFVGKSLAKPPK